MLKKTIKKCHKLEETLSMYKLWPDMIPENSYFQNLRSCYSKKNWDTIRKTAYKKSEYKCFICGLENVRLEAHEKWVYNYETSIQKLQSINALCFWCHRNIHLGHAKILMEQGRLDLEEVIKHWTRVNNKPRNNFKDCAFKAIELDELRNQFNWKIVDNLGQEIKTGSNIKNITKLVES